MESSYSTDIHSPFRGKKAPLPPIVGERDRAALEEVRNYIKTEIEKVRSSGVDTKRFLIYSTAFSMLISKVTVYKDILSDIKREYEDCIAALENGAREAKFLQVKIKTMSSIPYTYNGYLRRQKELEERLAVMNAENSRLENILNELIKSQDEEGSDNEDDKQEQILPKPERIEKRPIPGLPVSEWTNEKSLKSAVERLDAVLSDLQKQKKSCYVPIEKREETLQEFKEKMEDKERLADECQRLKERHKILKMANEAVSEYKELGLSEIRSMSDFILKRVTERSIRREASNMVESPHGGFDDDDPTREKEAEMILEYIEHFNELFFEKDYASAATHAAISPRGVLRDMETVLRFKEVSENFVGTPSPLVMFAEAFMYSSAAQNHYANEEMSYHFVDRALTENRADMVLHWAAQKCLKSCKKVADRLVEFSDSLNEPNQACLATAHDMYAATAGCKVLAAALLFKLKQPIRMLEYTYSEKFTRETYFELMKKSMDKNLIWMLSLITLEDISTSEDTARYSDYSSSLPFPLSLSLVALLSDGNEKEKNLVVDLLEDIYDGRMSQNLEAKDEDDPLFLACDLSEIIYQDGNDPLDHEDLVKHRWGILAAECENLGKFEVALDIEASLVVRYTIAKALSAIAEDEKEQFDYYT